MSLIFNIEYNDGSLTVWRAHGIGPGKCIRLSELTTPQVVQFPDLVKCDRDTAKRKPNAHFIKVESRPQPRTGARSQRCSDTEEEPVGDTSTVSIFLLSGGRMCENVSKIFLLTAPSGSWKTRSCFRE